MGLRRRLTGLAFGMLLSHLAHAQGPVPQGSPLYRILPTPPPAVGTGLPTEPSAPSEPEVAGSVAIRRVVIAGVTAYTAAQLDPLTDNLVGPDTKLARVEAARLAILNRYRDDGYVLTAVFARRDPQGTLTFLVTEGRIAEVKLDGDIGPAGTTVLQFLNHLTEERPIKIASLERWLLLTEEIPGVTMRAILRPSTDDPGALTLIAEVRRAPFSGLLVADNAAYPLTGPAEGLIVVDANSFTQFGDRTEALIYHTSGSTANFGQAASEFFVGGNGLRVRLYGGYGPTNPSSPLRDIGYHGTTTVFGVGATYPVIRRRQHTLDLTVSLDAIESDITIADGSVPISDDRLRVLRLGASYALHDLLLGGDRGATNTIKLRLSQGLPSFGASATVGDSSSAAPEKIGFTKINGEISRTQSLFTPWGDANVSLLGLLTGQKSNDTVPIVEQFQLGGLPLNPGYYSGEVTGDSALAFYTELQLNDTWNIAIGRQFEAGSQLFGFWSWGEVWNHQPLQSNRRISSGGGGLRLTMTRYLEFDLIGAVRSVLGSAATTGVASQSDGIYWRVILRY